MSTIGHNAVASDVIKSVVERIERLEEEKAALSQDIKEIYSEAKGNGLDTKTIRKVVARRKMDSSARKEADELLELYEGVFA